MFTDCGSLFSDDDEDTEDGSMMMGGGQGPPIPPAPVGNLLPLNPHHMHDMPPMGPHGHPMAQGGPPKHPSMGMETNNNSVHGGPGQGDVGAGAL